MKHFRILYGALCAASIITGALAAAGGLNPRDNTHAVTSRPAEANGGAATRRWFSDSTRTVWYAQDANRLAAQIRNCWDTYGIADVEGDDTLLSQCIHAAVVAYAQPIDGDLTALAGLSATGIPKRTGTNTWSQVTAPSGAIVGTTDTQALTGKSIDGSEIDSGTVAIANGGTAASDAPTARTSLKVEGTTLVGDADYAILATDKTIIQSANLTAPRTYTLPARSSVNAGREIIVRGNGVNGSNSIAVVAAGADNLTGVSTTITENTGVLRIFATGAGNWGANLLQGAGSRAAPSGAIVGTTDSQTLTNKTLVAPALGVASATSITVGSPTGGNEGAGTVNAVGVYSGGIPVVLPCITGDATATIQAELTAKHIVRGTTGCAYTITQSLTCPTNASTDQPIGLEDMTILLPAASFTNTDTTNNSGSTAVGFSCFGLGIAPWTPVYNVVMKGVHFISDTADGRYVLAAAFSNVTNGIVEGNEAYGMPCGRGISLQTVVNFRVSRNYIHDMNTNYASWSHQPQCTGIDIDGEHVGSLWSDGVTVDHNIIRNIIFGATAIGAYNYQTDGINPHQQSSHLNITSNIIDTVGEGIDYQSNAGVVADNDISNCYIFCIKFIYNANNVSGNVGTIKNCGNACVAFEGGSLLEVHDINLVGGSISNVDYLGVWGGGNGIKFDNATFPNSNNSVTQVKIDPGPAAGSHAVVALTGSTGTIPNTVTCECKAGALGTFADNVGTNTFRQITPAALALTSGTTTLTKSNLNAPVLANATGGAVIVNLPTAASTNDTVTIAKTDSSTNSVTVKLSGTAVSPPMQHQNDSVTYSWQNSAWVATSWKIAPITDVYTSGTPTWTRYPLTNFADVWAFAGGNGGGSGRQGAAGSGRAGGNGASAGSIDFQRFWNADLPTSLTVTVGTGGAGGTAQASADTNGIAGSVGNTSSFGTLLQAVNGAGAVGAGGTAAAVAGSTNQITSTTQIGAGSTNSITGTPNAGGASANGGGGAGGGITTGDAPQSGASGGNGSRWNVPVTAGTGGSSCSAGNSGNDIASSTTQLGGSGAGGGGGCKTGVGGDGATGGAPGGAGSGGGASLNGSASGKGGDGGRGEVRVTSYF